MLRLSETSQFLQISSFWEAMYALIGQLSSALWLAEYLMRVTEMLHPIPYCDSVSLAWRDKNNKTHYKRGICSTQWEHNYWLLMTFTVFLRVALHNAA